MNLHEVLEEVRRWVGDRIATSYTKEGCRVSMAGIPSERVVLDVDLAFPPEKNEEKQCDLVLFYIDNIQNNLVVVPMELKGSLRASEIIEQLREGIHIAEHLVPKGTETNCIPIAFYRKRIHKAQRKRLKSARIRFRSEEFPINTARCGHQGNLAQALAKSTKR